MHRAHTLFAAATVLLLGACDGGGVSGQVAQGTNTGDPSWQYATASGPPQGWAPQLNCAPPAGGPQATGDPISDFQNGVDPLSTQMRSSECLMVQQALADPQFQADYQRRRQQGWQMSPAQYAEYWLRTGHDTPEGTQRAFASQQRINSQMAGQNADYLAHQDQLRRQREGNYANDAWRRNEGGRIIQGTNSVYYPQTGRCYAQAYVEAGRAYEGEVSCPPGYPPPRQ